MFIVVHEANEYEETLINLDTVHFIRKNDDPMYPNVKTLISIGDGLVAMGVTEDYELIKNYISQQQPNGFYEFGEINPEWWRNRNEENNM